VFHYTVETDKSIETAIADLETNLKEEKFGVLWQLDLQAKLQEKGIQFPDSYRILEVCNPVEANRVLTEDRLVGYFLPCKIAVYEDAGITKIGMPKPTTFIQMIDNNNLREIAEDVEKRLIACMDKTK